VFFPIISNYIYDLVVEISINLKVVVAKAHVVKIVEFINVHVTPTGELKDLRTDNLVVCWFEEVSTVVLQVRGWDLEESTGFEGAQGEHPSGLLTVLVVFLLVRAVVVGPSPAHTAISAIVDDDVGVKHFQSMLFVHWVEYFKNIDTQELIVAIHQGYYIIRGTKLGDCTIDVG
jgi:uncharacterized protein YkvS